MVFDCRILRIWEGNWDHNVLIGLYIHISRGVTSGVELPKNLVVLD